MIIDPKKIDWDNIGFDLIETRSMYTASCRKDGSWSKGELVPFGNIKLSPAAAVLNYGQGVFEGTKAYRTVKDRIVLFRPEMNAKRMAMSSKRLCMPEMDENFFLNAVTETVIKNADYIPPYGKGSLYIRPIVFGSAPTLGVKPSEEYTFIVYVSPVGPYFKGNIKPLHLKITNNYHRAAPKGIGDVKAIGNYSASLYPSSLAKNEGFDEVIYLNAGNEHIVEELGSANLFAIKNNVVKTPRLAGSILAGVTRNSVLTIAKEKLGLRTDEKDLSLAELLEADEVFCAGTAVVVTPIGQITHNGKDQSISDGNMGRVTQDLRTILVGIQNEKIEDSFGWLYPIHIDN